MKRLLLSLSSAALAVFCAPSAHAVTVTDPLGDVFPAFAALFDDGEYPLGFDVLSFSVNSDGTNFIINATFAGDPEDVGDGVFVFGVNRGGGTALFGANQPGVLFDSVIVANPSSGQGSESLSVIIFGGATTQLDNDLLDFDDDSLSFTVPISLLPSTGFSPDQYGFNLWPRLPGGPFSNISDFAPDNATTTPIPEPGIWAAMIIGFGIMGGVARRQRSKAALSAPVG